MFVFKLNSIESKQYSVSHSYKLSNEFENKKLDSII